MKLINCKIRWERTFGLAEVREEETILMGMKTFTVLPMITG